MLILNIVSTICSSVALVLFLQWLMERISYSYGEGLASHGRLDVSIDPILGNVPAAERINGLAIALLPTIEEWRKKDRFGLASILTGWDQKLIQAGLRGRLSSEHFLALSFLSSLFIGGGMAVAFFLFGMSLAGAVFTFCLVAGGAFFIPTMVLSNIIANRISLIGKRLPFAIEFMLLSMEARAAFPSAIEIYCGQIPGDPFGQELRKALGDMEYGIPAQDALTSMAARIRSDDVSAFVLAVNTGLDTGQPIKDILRTQSDATRQRRFESAERIAKTASTRAIFPLFLVALAVLLLLVGPMAIKLAHEALF